MADFFKKNQFVSHTLPTMPFSFAKLDDDSLIRLNYLMPFLLHKFDSIIFCCFVVALLLDGHAYYSYKYDFMHSIN
jgi:hypothetical protein